MTTIDSHDLFFGSPLCCPGCRSVFSTGADVCCTGFWFLFFSQTIGQSLWFFSFFAISFLCFSLLFLLISYHASFSFFNFSPLLRRLSLSKGGSMRWLYFPGLFLFLFHPLRFIFWFWVCSCPVLACLMILA